MTPRATAKNAARISRVVGCAAGASPRAMMPGIKRGDSPHVVLNLHRSHNTSLLSPSRTRLVSFAFGERSGEGPSKPFKCSWFLTPHASGTCPAPRNTPAPTGQHYTARISQRPLKNPDHRTGASKVVRTVPCAARKPPDPQAHPHPRRTQRPATNTAPERGPPSPSWASKPWRRRQHSASTHGSAMSPRFPAPTGLRISAQGQPSLSEAPLGFIRLIGKQTQHPATPYRSPAASAFPSATRLRLPSSDLPTMNLPLPSTKGAAYRSPGQASLSERRPGSAIVTSGKQTQRSLLPPRAPAASQRRSAVAPCPPQLSLSL